MKNKRLNIIKENDKIPREFKILEQTLRIMKDICRTMSVSYNDLCMFTNILLPIGFKTQKFEFYNGHRGSCCPFEELSY